MKKLLVVITLTTLSLVYNSYAAMPGQVAAPAHNNSKLQKNVDQEWDKVALETRMAEKELKKEQSDLSVRLRGLKEQYESEIKRIQQEAALEKQAEKDKILKFELEGLVNQQQVDLQEKEQRIRQLEQQNLQLAKENEALRIRKDILTSLLLQMAGEIEAALQEKDTSKPKKMSVARSTVVPSQQLKAYQPVAAANNASEETIEVSPPASQSVSVEEETSSENDDIIVPQEEDALTATASDAIHQPAQATMANTEESVIDEATDSVENVEDSNDQQDLESEQEEIDSIVAEEDNRLAADAVN